MSEKEVKYTPVQLNNAKASAAALVEFLGTADVKVPGPILEAVMSGKSLLRAVASESLILCQGQEVEPPALEDD